MRPGITDPKPERSMASRIQEVQDMAHDLGGTKILRDLAIAANASSDPAVRSFVADFIEQQAKECAQGADG